jgi:hypothetical protein
VGASLRAVVNTSFKPVYTIMRRGEEGGREGRGRRERKKRGERTRERYHFQGRTLQVLSAQLPRQGQALFI